MQFNSLEHYIREKVREVEQSPVPKSEWDRDAAFLRVQNQLRHKEDRSKRLYYRIAAALLFGVLSSLLVYQLKFTNEPISEVTAKVDSAVLPQIILESSVGKGPGAVESKAIGIQHVEVKLAKAAPLRKQPTQRKPARQAQKTDGSEVDKPDSISVAALAVVPGPGKGPAAVTEASSPESAAQSSETASSLRAPSKSIEIVVVIGGRTLARMANEGDREAVALGSPEEPRQQYMKKALKKGKAKSFAINRVRNPLSLNTEI